MGEIADGIINGDFDEETGEWLGPGGGFPRSRQRDIREAHEKKRAIKASGAYTDYNKANGVIAYLGYKKDETAHKVVKEYAKHMGWEEIKVNKICVKISDDFATFKNWAKENKGR